MWHHTGPCSSQGLQGTAPSVQEGALGWCQPQNDLPRGRKELRPMPAAPSRAAGCTARAPSSPTALLRFQRHKKLLGTQLHPHLSAVISFCTFSSKPTAFSSHAPAGGHYHFTSISSHSTQEISRQLTERRVTRSLGWSLPFTQGGLSPVGMGIPSRVWCHCHGSAAHIPPQSKVAERLQHPNPEGTSTHLAATPFPPAGKDQEILLLY